MALGNATFYTYTGDPRKANKVPDMSVISSTAALKPLEILSNLMARIVVKYNAAFMNADYFSISDESTNLYYKITDRQRGTAGELIATGTLDGLASLWSAVKDCYATCARNTTKYNSQFVDPKYMMYQNREVETKKLGSFSNFGDYKIIICYNGTLPKSGGITEHGTGEYSWINPW